MAPSHGETCSKLKRPAEPTDPIVALFQELCEDDWELFRYLVRALIEELDEVADVSPYLELPAASQKRPRLSLVQHLSVICDEDLRKLDATLQSSDSMIEFRLLTKGDTPNKKPCLAVKCVDQNFVAPILHVLSARSGEQECSLELLPSTTMQELQRHISETINMPPFLQRLSIEGVVLQNDIKLFEYVMNIGCRTVLLERLDPARIAALPCLERGEGSLCELGENAGSDREMVLAAVQGNGMELRFAAEDLRKDREIVLTAVRRNGHALEFVAEELKQDREVVLEAVKQRGASLRFAAKHLRADYDIALAAVQRDSEALQFVASHLKVDRKIAHATVAGGGLECFFNMSFTDETLEVEDSAGHDCVDAISGSSADVCGLTDDSLAVSDAYQ